MLLISVFRVSEEHFWRNYFYRVTLIKQTYELSTITATPEKSTGTTSPRATDTEHAIATSTPAPKSLPLPDNDLDNADTHSNASFAADEETGAEGNLDSSLAALGIEPQAKSPPSTPAKGTTPTPTPAAANDDSTAEWEKQLEAELNQAVV